MEEKTKNPSAWKAEMAENNQLEMDDRMPFACDNCGGCCRNQEDLIMSPYDIFRMARHLGLTMQEWTDLYGRVHIGPDSRMPIVRIRLIGVTSRCPFLKDNRCSLQQIKPDICALFPLGRSIGFDKDGKRIPDPEKTEVTYFHSGCQCGSRDAGNQTVQEWLDSFHLREREDYYIQWSGIINEMALKLRKMEADKESGEVVRMARGMVFMLLYMNYDTSEDFEGQFRSNVQELRENFDDFIKVAKKLRKEEA